MNTLKQSIKIYEDRMAGKTDQWSATTRCTRCGDLWMWGVEDNLDFTCPDCEKLSECCDAEIQGGFCVNCKEHAE